MRESVSVASFAAVLLFAISFSSFLCDYVSLNALPDPSTTTDRAPARWVEPITGGALFHSTMSRGGSRAVSIQRSHGGPPAVGGRSKSSGSQYAFKIKYRERPCSCRSASNARL